MTHARTYRGLYALFCILAFTTFAASLLLNSGSVYSQSAPKPEFTLRMVGNSRTSLPWKVTEWFAREAETRSNGRIKIELASSPELGMTGFERIQVLQQGLIDIGDVLPTFVSGQLPVLEAQDLPGIYTDFAQMRTAHMAFQRVLQQYQEKLGGKFLGSYSYEWNYVFSAKPITAVADIKNKKVRTFSVAIDDFYTALGAVPVSLPFAEAYTALSRGTVDAVQTASGNALGIKLWEVAPYVLDVQAGAGPAALIVSQRTWNRLPADLQAMFVKLGEEFTQRGWDDAQAASGDARQRLEAAGFKWTTRADDWKPAIDKAVREAVIPKWSRRAGPEGVKLFNEILGPIVGYRAAL
jgi:TRAP-type C4-dicarboxylate transport system substrate-binding protein